MAHLHVDDVARVGVVRIIDTHDGDLGSEAFAQIGGVAHLLQRLEAEVDRGIDIVQVAFDFNVLTHDQDRHIGVSDQSVGVVANIAFLESGGAVGTHHNHGVGLVGGIFGQFQMNFSFQDDGKNFCFRRFHLALVLPIFQSGLAFADVIATVVFGNIMRDTGGFHPHKVQVGASLHRDGNGMAHGVEGAVGEVNTYNEILIFHNV